MEDNSNKKEVVIKYYRKPVGTGLKRYSVTITLPKEIVRALELNQEDPEMLEMFMRGDELIIKKDTKKKKGKKEDV